MTAHRDAVQQKRCVRCWKITRPENLTYGYGPDCARLLGLIGTAPDTGQDGPDLFDILAETILAETMRAAG